MCAEAVENSSWLMVDPFETAVRNSDGEPEYVPTARVLSHFDHEINEVLGGVGGQKVKICLLAGSDLIQTMSTPNLWSPTDLDIILGQYGAFIIERSGSCFSLTNWVASWLTSLQEPISRRHWPRYGNTRTISGLSVKLSRMMSVLQKSGCFW